MSCKLWQFFLQDDVENFKRILAGTSYAPANTDQTSGRFGSPGTGIGLSPSNLSKSNRRVTGVSPGSPISEKTTGPPTTGFAITRADINARDRFGRTLLHLAASSQKESAYDFAVALLSVPFLDIYAQDAESGWTALHRALYAGNIAISHALMTRDAKGATNFSALTSTLGAGHHPPGSLIKIKDREGNSPFDVFGATVTSRDIVAPSSREHVGRDNTLSDSSSDVDARSIHEEVPVVQMQENLMGDEVFTFGSNKNLTLGQGDEDDRQYPERISLRRPDNLLHRLNHERQSMRQHRAGSSAAVEHREFDSVADLPILVRSQPLIFQDVVMSKLHTGIITNDPESNLFMSGFGPGGRLGTGDEGTRFSFVCIESGGLAGKKVVALALGQDHSIAVSQQGEVFTWGSNKHGQLGYALPRSNQKNDTPVQTSPRQIFNPFKKEIILGAAASSIHSAVFTSTGLYTFGKNEGQLGLIDADARSLELQIIPRKVGASLFTSTITMVAAIDRATTCLLENHEVWVFTHYGYSKLVFPLDGISAFLKNSFLTTRYSKMMNCITKITAGGNTICAMSSFGEVYSINVNKKADTSSTAASTTNPAKIRNSLPQPSRVWSIKKSHMAVRDVDVGQDGSIIICTESGSAWRKEKRAKIKTSQQTAGDSNHKDFLLKDYKFVRIPGLSRVVAVRSNAFGAYAAVHSGCEVTKKQIIVGKQGLWDDLWPLLPFNDLLVRTGETDISMNTSHSSSAPENTHKQGDQVGEAFLESSVRDHIRSQVLACAYQNPVWMSSTRSDVRLPVHDFMVTSRSPVLRQALKQFRSSYYYSIPEFLAIEYDKDGQIQIQFQEISFLALFNLVLYIYTDQVLEVWTNLRYSPHNAPFYRQVRIEVMKLASQLELKELEAATRMMFQPRLQMNLDVECAINDPCFFDDGDTLIELEGTEVRAHSQILCQRCPFFQGLFYGRAAGRWVSARREGADVGDSIRIDLKHMDPKVFAFVLRHIYADTDDELFEDVCTDDLEDLVDLIIDVMAAANELMLDRLAQICQKLLGQFVNTRNVCHFLNAVAPCTETSFKQAAFEFISLNLEVMLENRLLDDLDPELLFELDDVCRDNQTTSLPVSRGRNTLEYAVARYPEIVPQLEEDIQRRIDSMRLSSRLHEDEIRDEKFRVGSLEKSRFASPLAQKSRSVTHPSTEALAMPESPLLKSKQSSGDMMFQMDDENVLSSPTPIEPQRTPLQPQGVLSSQPQHRGSTATPRSHPANRELDDTFPSSSPHSLDVPPLSLSKGKQPSASPHVSGELSRSKAPWGSVDSPNTKVGLSGIMAEASSVSKQSALSSGLASSKEVSGPSNFASSKLSQKERKKMKQQQVRESAAEPELELSKKSAVSPWQTVPSRSMKPLAGTDQPSNQRSPSQSRSSSRAAMTLRQTVAGTPPSQNAPPTPKQHSKHAAQSTPPRPPTQQQKQGEYTSAHPTQSRAYSPTPAEISRSATSSSTPQQFSLASILHEQQTEKDSIREVTTAKHNLHDIQVEQEFQEWWDKESRRVMEEEAAVAAAAATTTKTSRSGKAARGGNPRGGGRGDRGAGKGKGRVHSAGKQQRPSQQQSAGVEQDHNPSSASKPDAGTERAHQHPHTATEGSGGHDARPKSGHHPQSGRGRGHGRGRDRAHHPHHHNRGHAQQTPQQ